MTYQKSATKQDPCPTCGATDGCKEIKGKWLCRNKHGVLDDLQLFEVVNGHKLIGKKDWLAFVVADEEGTFKRKEVVKQTKIIPEDVLSAKERNRHYQKIAKHLTLSSFHEQKLLTRGLSKAQIKKLGYVSIEKGGSSLPNSIPTSIPGVFDTYYGKQIGSNYTYGIIIWSRNEKDQIIGYQIALDDELLKEGFPKYRWATTKKKGEITASQHLKGEMPINYQGQKRDTLYIVDSIPKVNYTSCRHNIDVIGVGGNGHLRASKEQFKQVLDANNYKTIINAVDAGDIQNIDTMRGLVKDYNLCHEFGHEMKVAWWGQTTKGKHQDIDELENLDYVSIISFDRFLGLYRGEKKEDLVSRITSKVKNKESDVAVPTPTVLTKTIEDDETVLFYPSKGQFLDKVEKGESEEIKGVFENVSESFFRKKMQKSIDTVFNNSHFVYKWSPDMEYPDFNKLPKGVTVKIILPKKYKKHRIRVLNDLRSQTRFIFDNSQTGSGKSHGIKDMDKVLYLDNNYKNPSIEGIKEMPFLPPRSEYGLYDYEGQVYNDPDSEKRDNGERISKGNCFLKPIFRSHEEKGYQAEEGKYLCDVCPYSKKCTKGQDNERGLYGFRAMRRQAMNEIRANGQGRVHPSQLQAKEIKSNFKNFTLVIEEAGGLTNISKTTFTQNDFNTWYREINKRELSQNVREYALILIDTVIDLLAACKRDADSRYGLTHEEIIKVLPRHALNDIELKELAELALIPDDVFDGLADNQLEETGISKEEKTRNRGRNASLNAFNREQARRDLNALPKNIGLIFDGLLRRNQVDFCFAIEFDKGSNSYLFSVNQFDGRVKEVAAVATSMIFLDATITEAQLRGLYGLENETLVIFQEEISTLDNIKAFNVNVPGLSSNQQWSSKRITSLQQMIALIKQQSPDKKFAVVAPKKYAVYFNTPYYYGNHDRGSNELKDYDGLIFLGRPMPNLGSQRIEYDLIYRDSDFDFEQYYLQVIKENRIQGLGRHRAQWKKEKTLVQYYFSTDEDLSYFEDYGVNLQSFDYSELFPTTAPKSSLASIKLVLENIFSAAKDLTRRITQTEIAKKIGVAPQSISKTLRSKFGGNWEAFFALQQSLYSIHKGLFKIPKESWEKITHDNDRLLSLLNRDPNKAINDFLKYLETGDDDPVFWLLGLPEAPHSHYFTAMMFIETICSLASPLIRRQLTQINNMLLSIG